jgi:hypothetical protein
MTHEPTQEGLPRCQCELGRFTCRACLQDAKPWFYTLKSGASLYVLRGWSVDPAKEGAGS